MAWSARLPGVGLDVRGFSIYMYSRVLREPDPNVESWQIMIWFIHTSHYGMLPTEGSDSNKKATHSLQLSSMFKVCPEFSPCKL